MRASRPEYLMLRVFLEGDAHSAQVLLFCNATLDRGVVLLCLACHVADATAASCDAVLAI